METQKHMTNSGSKVNRYPGSIINMIVTIFKDNICKTEE